MKEIKEAEKKTRHVRIELNQKDLFTFIFDQFKCKNGEISSVESIGQLDSILNLQKNEVISDVKFGINVPGGGDWSNMYLEFDEETPIKATITIERV